MLPFASLSSTELDRKSLRRPDDFYQTLKNFFDKLANNTRAVVAGLVVLFLAGLAFAYVTTRKDQKSEVARDAYYHATQTLEKELTAVAAAEPRKPVPAKKDAKGKEVKQEPAKATAADVEFKKFDVDAKLPETIKQLSAVAETYPGTRSAHEAQITIGNLYYRHGQPDKAVKWFDEATKSAPSQQEKGLALYSLGYAQEDSGKAREAIETYQKSLNLGDVGLKGDLLMALARSYELGGDKAKAKETYDRVLKEMSDSDYAKTAEVLKAQLE